MKQTSNHYLQVHYDIPDLMLQSIVEIIKADEDIN